MTILAVTGMTREAEIVGGNFSNGRGSGRKPASHFSSNRFGGVIAVAGGGDAAGLAAKLDALHGDITGVISIGLGGALSPLLKVGDVVIADQILISDHLPRARDSAPALGEVAVAGSRASEGRRGQTFRCDEAWRVRLAARLPHAHQGPVEGSDVILADANTKAALFNSSGALAVDMESQVAARFAAARGLKLAGLRVISDDARHMLPPAALVAMLPDGGISLKRVLWSLVKQPLQLPALIRTGRASNKAFAELLRCRDLCGVGIAGLDG